MILLGKIGREIAADVAGSGIASGCKIDVALPKIVLDRAYGHKSVVEVSSCGVPQAGSSTVGALATRQVKWT